MENGKFGIIVDGVTHLIVDDNEVQREAFADPRNGYPVNACEKYCSLYNLCYSTNENCIANTIVEGVVQYRHVDGVHFEQERSHTEACKEESFC